MKDIKSRRPTFSAIWKKTSRMSEPVIRLQTAELLHVVFAATIQEIRRNTEYDTYNLSVALKAYEVARTREVLDAGWTMTDIELIQRAALDAITAYLDEKRMENSDEDFEQWKGELGL